MEELILAIPHAEYALVPFIRREGSVISEEAKDEYTILRCRIPERLMERMAKYKIPGA